MSETSLEINRIRTLIDQKLDAYQQAIDRGDKIDANKIFQEIASLRRDELQLSAESAVQMNIRREKMANGDFMPGREPEDYSIYDDRGNY
jgi:hypothetical protein